jgi:serine/threonine protein kinase
MPEPAAVRPSLSADAMRRVDLACDAFDRAWRDGSPSRIEDCLATADPTAAPTLRDELIRVELEWRFQRGDRPAEGEYRARFPECAGSLPAWLREAESAVAALSSVSGETRTAPTVDFVPDADTEPAPRPEGRSRQLPRLLGEYELLDRLGAGGMGEVYRARHRRLGKLVAVKVMPPGLRGAEQALARFQRETEAVGQLDHPHLVEAHDAGEQDGIVYLVLKLIDGIDLQRLVKQHGPLPVTEACRLVRQAALGLQYLHERGLVHRDVKPANLMRTPAGDIKVLDLGLSRRHSVAEDLTNAGQVLGTPDYLAPEQITNAAGADVQADLYGLGATLFYLLAGRAPFAHHRGVSAKLDAHGGEAAPDVRTLRPEVPAEVAAMVARLLAKRPGARYATAAELADALAPFAATTQAPPRPRRQLAVLIGGSALLAVLAGTALLVWLRNHRGNGTGPDGPGVGGIVPVAVKPVRVLSLDVNHFAKEGESDRQRGVLGRRSFTTHRDDAVTVTGKLSAPAYCYLIAYRPDGTEELCFPEKEDVRPPLTDEPRYPSVTAGVLYGLNEGEGLEAFVLVVSAKPLPPYVEWRRQRGTSPWRKSEAQAGVVWRLDGTALRAHTADDPDARGKGQELRGAGALPQLADWLRQGEGVEAVSAVAFAVRPRE